jgi:hypothetical protein
MESLCCGAQRRLYNAHQATEYGGQMTTLDRKELAHAQRQAEEILAAMSAMSRFSKRLWRSLANAAALARLAAEGNVDELIRQAQMGLLHPMSRR